MPLRHDLTPWALRVKVLRRTNPQIGVAGDLQRTAAGALRQVAFGYGRHTPGDAAKQEVLVVGSRVLPEYFPVLLAQAAKAQAARAFNLSQNGCIHHFSPVLLALTTAHQGSTWLTAVNWHVIESLAGSGGAGLAVNQWDGRSWGKRVWLPECHPLSKRRLENRNGPTISVLLTGRGVSEIQPGIK
jgi:hypothetical protein